MSLPIGLFGDVPVFPGCHDVQLRHLPIRVLRRDNISYVAQRAGSLPITPYTAVLRNPAKPVLPRISVSALSYEL